MKKTNSGKTNLPNIRWMLVGYDLIVYVVAAVILLGIYRGMDKLTPVGMFQQISISLICIFGARFVGKIYGQVWRYGGIQCYIRLLFTDAIAFLAYLCIEILLPVQRITFARMLSLGCIAIIAIILIVIYRNRRDSIINWIVILSLSLLTATIIENGALRRYFTLFYPVIALCCLVTVQLRNEKKMTEFINAISNLFFVLCLLNLVCILYNSQLFGMDTYLIGIKNQIGYALNIGLLLVYMDAYIRRDKFKLHVYICIYFLTVVKVASSSSFIGASIILLYFLVPFIRKMILKIDFRIMLIGYIFLFVGIVFFSTVVLNLEPVKFFIEDILGKNVTLTNRTVIWVKVISGIIQKPFLGHGIQESSNLFYIHIDFWNRVAVDGTYSAHNQILQTLYEGGTIAIALIFSLLWHVGKEIKECSNDNISSICKLMLIVTLVMMLAESPGLDSLLIIVTLVSVFVKKMKIEG